MFDVRNRHFVIRCHRIRLKLSETLYEVNAQAVTAFNTIGIGYAGYHKFSMLMNCPLMSEKKKKKTL